MQQGACFRVLVLTQQRIAELLATQRKQVGIGGLLGAQTFAQSRQAHASGLRIVREQRIATEAQLERDGGERVRTAGFVRDRQRVLERDACAVEIAPPNK